MANYVDNFIMPTGESVLVQDNTNKEYPSQVMRSIVGGNALFVGDSYTYGTGASDHNAGDTKRFSSLICNALGMTEYNVAVGSTGFVDPGSSGQQSPFITQITNWYNANQDKASDIDVIFISGGYNDVFYDDATFSAMVTASQNIINYACEHFPNAFIVFTPMMWRGWGFTTKAINLYCALVQGAMTAQGCERVIMLRDAYSWTFFEGACASDHIHPNDTGHSRIAHCIMQGINGQGSDFTSWQQFSASSGTTWDNTPIMWFKDFVVNLQPFYAYFDSIANGSSAVIATCPNECCPATNVYGVIYSGNKYAGIYSITATGNVYVFNTSGAALTGCYFQPASWPIYGKEY